MEELAAVELACTAVELVRRRSGLAMVDVVAVIAETVELGSATVDSCAVVAGTVELDSATVDSCAVVAQFLLLMLGVPLITHGSAARFVVDLFVEFFDLVATLRRWQRLLESVIKLKGS